MVGFSPHAAYKPRNPAAWQCKTGLPTHGGGGYFQAMEHSPGFLALVNEARPHIKEITVAEARERLARNPLAILMDVREDHEWAAGHAETATHLGKGVLERDLEKLVPDKEREIIMYCGGGFRSALTAHAAAKMGYRNAISLMGGYKAMVAAGWSMAR
jgi:rhodanese-related sulfurtransferase